MDFPVLMISKKRRARGVRRSRNFADARGCAARARARAARAGGGPTTRTETSKRADQYKAGCASHTAAGSSYWRLYVVVYMST